MNTYHLTALILGFTGTIMFSLTSNIQLNVIKTFLMQKKDTGTPIAFYICNISVWMVGICMVTRIFFNYPFVTLIGLGFWNLYLLFAYLTYKGSDFKIFNKK